MKGDHLNQIKGQYGEDLAANFLRQAGYEIMARNYKCQYGEIDLIVKKDQIIHFVEVKNRTRAMIPGRYAVNVGKQKHIRNTANFYLMQHHHLYECLTAFDVVEITDGQIEFLENCFY